MLTIVALASLAGVEKGDQPVPRMPDRVAAARRAVLELLYEKGANFSLILRGNQHTLLKTAQTELVQQTTEINNV